MKFSTISKAFCIGFMISILLSCGGGGGGGSSSTPAPAAQTPNISVASNVNLGGTVLNNSVDQSMEIKNTGNASLKIGQIPQPNSPFSVVLDNCSLKTISPSGTCSLTARFTPTSQGSSTAPLSIPSNDPDSSTVNVQLSGEGYGLTVWINSINSGSCPAMSADVTVTDPINKTSISGLTGNNFTVTQNGQTQSITVIPVAPSPVSLVLSLDWSDSLSTIRSQLQSAANSMIGGLSNSDWAAVGKFTNVIQFVPDTSFIQATAQGKTELQSYINGSFQGGETYLYDSIYQSIARAAQGPTQKRVVILFSDGTEDHQTGPPAVHTLDQAIAYAVQNKIPIFTIFYINPGVGLSYGRPEIMQRLASETGGQYFNAQNINISDIFQQILNLLNNKYTINYTSTTCSGSISVDVRVDWNSLYGKDSRTITLP